MIGLLDESEEQAIEQDRKVLKGKRGGSMLGMDSSKYWQVLLCFRYQEELEDEQQPTGVFEYGYKYGFFQFKYVFQLEKSFKRKTQTQIAKRNCCHVIFYF